MEPSWSDILNIVQVVGLPMAILLAGARGMWVYGRTYRAMEKDRDEWKVLALKGIDVTKHSTNATRDSMRTLAEVVEAIEAVRKAEEESR